MKAKLTTWLCLGLWAVPVIRWARFEKWAADYHTDTGSINSANDLNYASAVGFCYLVGIGSSLVLCWLVNQRGSAVNWTLWAMCLACLSFVICMRPEEPIVLFPSFSPLRWGIWFVALGAVGLASRFDSLALSKKSP